MARRHIPYVVTAAGGRWEAHHAETGALLARADTESLLRSTCDSMTEDAPENTASRLVAMSVVFVGYCDSKWDVIAAGLDPNARNFYHKHGRWRGTRFSDGSAVIPCGGHGLPVEFLDSFAGGK